MEEENKGEEMQFELQEIGIILFLSYLDEEEPIAARPYVARVESRANRRRLRGQPPQSILTRLFEQAFGGRGNPIRRMPISTFIILILLVRNEEGNNDSSSSDDVAMILNL